MYFTFKFLIIYILLLNLGQSLEQALTLKSLEAALERGCPEIHHSGQGMQYAATAYIAMLIAAGVAISIASVGETEASGYAEEADEDHQGGGGRSLGVLEDFRRRIAGPGEVPG